MLKGIGSALELGAQSVLSVFGVRSAYEQPPYEVVGRAGPAEVRRYGPRLAAETTLDPGARDRAFGLLAGYIFGKNRARTDGGGAKIAMATPVETRSERIAMTTPVEMASAGPRVTMRFFLPGSLSRATAPEPTDPRVRVVEVPGETLAVLRFSGSTGDARVAERKAALLRGLRGSAWEPDGEPVFLGYDPPFTPPFLRRNEVAVRVEPRR